MIGNMSMRCTSWVIEKDIAKINLKLLGDDKRVIAELLNIEPDEAELLGRGLLVAAESARRSGLVSSLSPPDIV